MCVVWPYQRRGSPTPRQEGPTWNRGGPAGFGAAARRRVFAVPTNDLKSVSHFPPATGARSAAIHPLLFDDRFITPLARAGENANSLVIDTGRTMQPSPEPRSSRIRFRSSNSSGSRAPHEDRKIGFPNLSGYPLLYLDTSSAGGTALWEQITKPKVATKCENWMRVSYLRSRRTSLLSDAPPIVPDLEPRRNWRVHCSSLVRPSRLRHPDRL